MQYDRRAGRPGFRNGKTRNGAFGRAWDSAGSDGETGCELVDPDFDVVDVGDLLRDLAGASRADSAGAGA